MADQQTSPEVQSEVKVLESEERQTIVHCTCNEDAAFRIWPTTYLIERESGRRAQLITAFNISFAPNWTLNDGKGFTLIFEGLSKQCGMFDLVEEIPQAGGFEARNIMRNSSDVYHVHF